MGFCIFKVAQWTKDVAALWKAFSDEEKKPYAKLAAADKERYDKEVCTSSFFVVS